MKKKILVVGINGSPHKKGTVSKLLGKTLDFCRKYGADIKLINLADYKVLPTDGVLRKYPEKRKDDADKLHKILVEADAIIFSSPTYWFSVSGLMKNFIDRMTCLEGVGFDYKKGEIDAGHLLEGKVAAAIVCEHEGGGTNVLMTLSLFFNTMGMIVPPYGLVWYSTFAPQKWVDREFKLMAKNVVSLVKIQEKDGLRREGDKNWGYDSRYEKPGPML